MRTRTGDGTIKSRRTDGTKFTVKLLVLFNDERDWYITDDYKNFNGTLVIIQTNGVVNTGKFNRGVNFLTVGGHGVSVSTEENGH